MELNACPIHGERCGHGQAQNLNYVICQYEIHAFLRNLIRIQGAQSACYTRVRRGEVCTVRHTKILHIGKETTAEPDR